MKNNETIFEAKVNFFKEAGLQHFSIHDDSPNFPEYCDSGFLDWLIHNFEHEIILLDQGFRFFLNKRRVYETA